MPDNRNMFTTDYHQPVSFGGMSMNPKNSPEQARADMFAPYFGRITVYDPPDPYSTRPAENYDLPKALDGKRNGYMSNILIERVTQAQCYPTIELLPWFKTDKLDVEWDVWIFNKHALGRTPDESVSRLISSQFSSGRESCIRWGLAMKLEHGFMKTQMGKTNYAMGTLQIQIAVIETANHMVVDALYNAQPYRNPLLTKAGGLTRIQLNDIIAAERKNWGIMHKQDNCFNIIVNDADAALEDRTGSKPNHVIMPRGALAAAAKRPENRLFLYNGPMNRNPLNNGTMQVRESQAYVIPGGQRDDPSFRQRVIGHCARVHLERLTQKDHDHFNYDMYTTYIWDEERNDFFPITYREQFGKAGLIDNWKSIMGPGGVTSTYYDADNCDDDCDDDDCDDESYFDSFVSAFGTKNKRGKPSVKANSGDLMEWSKLGHAWLKQAFPNIDSWGGAYIKTGLMQRVSTLIAKKLATDKDFRTAWSQLHADANVNLEYKIEQKSVRLVQPELKELETLFQGLVTELSADATRKTGARDLELWLYLPGGQGSVVTSPSVKVNDKDWFVPNPDTVLTNTTGPWSICDLTSLIIELAVSQSDQVTKNALEKRLVTAMTTVTAAQEAEFKYKRSPKNIFTPQWYMTPVMEQIQRMFLEWGKESSEVRSEPENAKKHLNDIVTKVQEMETEGSLISMIPKIVPAGNGKTEGYPEDLSASNVVQILKSMKFVNYAHYVKFMIDHNIYTPITFSVLRPYSTWLMGDALFSTKGGVMGVTAFKDPDVMLSDNSAQKMHELHFTVWMKAVIKNKDPIYRASNVMCQRYISGCGHDFWDASSQRDLIDHRQKFNKRDGYIVAHPVNWVPKDTWYDITAKPHECLQPAIREQEYANIMPGLSVYSDHWGWEQNKALMEFNGTFHNDHQRYNTMVHEEHQFLFSNGNFDTVQINKGHWGERVYAGCHEAHTTAGIYLQPVNYQRLSTISVTL